MRKKPRYIVVPSVPKGYFWWTIADTEDKTMPNAPVADFREDMPDAEAEARALCDRLNQKEES